MKRINISKYPAKPVWLSEEGLKTLNGGYLVAGETPKDMHLRLAYTAAKILKREGLQQDFFDIFYNGWLGPSTPVAANFGTDKGLSISCYLIHLADTIESIYGHLKEAAKMSKRGGGVGATFSDIRGSGTSISGGGVSTGVIPWIKQYDYAASAVSQGGVRRGAFAYYLDIEHPDALDLLHAKDHLQGDPRNMIDGNIAFVIRDESMEKIRAGDPKLKPVFDKALEMSLKVGSPYFLFIDNVNRQNPEAYNIHNLKVSTSNLCLTGDTLVATKEGAQPIKDLVGKEVIIFDGEDWVKNDKFFYQGKSEVLEVTLAGGKVIKMTPEHRCKLSGYGHDVLAKDLEIGQVMHHVDLSNPGIILDWYETPDRFSIVSIKRIEEPQDVYCTKVGSTGYFALANGVITGNCSEITLYTDDLHSAICCLSSLNLAKWFEWKDWVGTSGKTVPELAVYFLDAVMSSFIKDASKDEDLVNAVRSAVKGRPLGIGSMGEAYLYQTLGIPFKSKRARELNIETHKFIQDMARKASKDMAKEFGQPEWCEGTEYRHTHLTAVAPTTSNSVITGAFSPGIEPSDSNTYTKKQAKGSFVRKNPLLVELLESKGYNTPEIWDSILKKNGSVMHLDCLTFDEKNVFLTAREIDQEELIRQAADRQPYVCQAMSLNRFVHPDISPGALSSLVMLAYANGVKSMYYTKSWSPLVLERVKNDAYIITKPDCPYCTKAKELLESLGANIVEIPREEVNDFIWKTVPQIWYQGHYIGGYEELLDFKVSGEKREVKDSEGTYSEEHINIVWDTEDSSGCVSCEG